MSKREVNSNCPEFGYELLSAVPYAYNLYLKGELERTISGFDTKCLYFFSPEHIESNCNRSWNNMNKLWKTNFPNIHIHQKDLDWSVFSPPPFKEHYKKSAITFQKETLVIFNRYNIEWGRAPINYLDLNTLEKLFTMLEDKYQVIYINIKGHKKYYDGVDALDLGDEDVLQKHPKVISINDLIKKYPESTYNEIQLRVFANCQKYISSNGGQLILSAFFGGENVIFSKECREISENVNSFHRWYHKLGGGVFQHVDNYNDLIELVRQKWVENKPLFNILIRTSARPNYFKDCVESIYRQTYKNWQIIIGIDDIESEKYTFKAKGRTVKYNFDNISKLPKPNEDEYGIFFKFNLYFNELHKNINDGYIIYLDDDDKIYGDDSLMNLSNEITDENTLVFWRVKFPDRLVPNDENFLKSPVMRDVSGIGFTFHNKYKIDWEPFKRGDYRVAKALSQIIPNKKYFNQVITELQRQTEDGFGMKDDKKTNPISQPINLSETSDSENKKFEVISTIEKKETKINYEKINSVFEKQHIYKSIQQQTQPKKNPLKLNSSTIQNLMTKNKKKIR